MGVSGLTGVAVAGVIAGMVAASGAEAAPFRIVSDGPESVWVLDAASGQLTWCRLTTISGPKLIDVAGVDYTARPIDPRRGGPACSQVLAPSVPAAREAREALRIGYGALGGYGSLGRYGALGYGQTIDAAGGDITIVRPRAVNVYSDY